MIKKMHKRAISISLAKIDYNKGRPYLYILADCPEEYYFTEFFITVHMIQNGEWVEKRYDGTNAVFGNEQKTNIVLNMPISALEETEGPAIYLIKLAAKGAENDLEIEDTMYLSDVQYVYRDLLDGVLSDCKCEGVSDDIIKKYLTLYAHQKALDEGDLDVAKYLFKLMHKSFSKCNTKPSRTVNCGCYDKCK